ncbi:MAG: YciI family protein [Stackebrandtia sp.]
MKYMLLMQGPKGDWDEFATMPPKDVKAHIDFMCEVDAKLTDSGELVDAQGLTEPDQARVVRAQVDGPPAVTDGPFPESKEFLAGYWIVQCDSPERAVEIATYISTAPGRDGVPTNIPVQVREVASAPPQMEA